jgi:hypothetical protein
MNPDQKFESFTLKKSSTFLKKCTKSLFCRAFHLQAKPPASQREQVSTTKHEKPSLFWLFFVDHFCFPFSHPIRIRTLQSVSVGIVLLYTVARKQRDGEYK